MASGGGSEGAYTYTGGAGRGSLLLDVASGVDLHIDRQPSGDGDVEGGQPSIASTSSMKTVHG